MHGDLAIRSLTDTEAKILRQALETLQLTSATRTTENWAAGVMLEDDADFVKRLVFVDKCEKTFKAK